MINKREILDRSTILMIIIVIIGLATVLRVLELKTILRPKFKKYANIIRTMKPYGRRGDIYSVGGKIISTTGLVYDVHWDASTPFIRNHPDFLQKNLYPLADSLAHFFNKPISKVYSYLLSKYQAHKKYIYIAKDLTSKQVNRLKSFPIFNKTKFKGGLIVEPHEKRIHPFGWLAYRTIGDCKLGEEEQTPTCGIEYSYNSQLSGKTGIVIYRIGPYHTILEKRIIIPPENGWDLRSTLDMNIQYFLETALLKRVQELKADRGIGIIMDVHTGEIRAMANLEFSPLDSNYHENLNNAVQWLYEPGSVMKAFSMLALFEQYPNIKLSMLVNTGNGTYRVGRHIFKDDKKGGYGTITLKQVVEHSSNVGVAKIITHYFKTKPLVFINQLIAIGVDRKTGIDLANEATKPLKDPTDKTWWKKVSPGQLAIGYEHSMTAIQILALYNAIANNGKYVTPHLVRSFIHDGQEIPNTNIPIAGNSIASISSIHKVQKMLKGVVLHGTASRTVKNNIVSIAGKTGTAQIYEQGIGKYTDHYNTTFVGYFPANYPRYSMIIVISNPYKNHSGALAAGPVFRQVAEKIYQYDMSLHRPENYIVNDWQETQQLPRIKSGFRQPIEFLFSFFHLPHTDLPRRYRLIKAITKSNIIELQPYFFRQNAKYKTLTMSAEDADYIFSQLNYYVKLQGIGSVVSEQNLGKQTIKLILK